MRLYVPASCDEAVALLAHAPRPLSLVAGATDVCAQCNEGLEVASLVDIGRIGVLKAIAAHEGELRIGGAASLHAVAADPLLRRENPGLARAFGRIANVRIRFRATLGGNLMARRTRYESAILLLAANARLAFRSAERASTLSVADFIEHGAPDAALLEYIALPLGQAPHFAYDRSLRPAMTLAFSAARGDAQRRGRAVIATEYLRPVALPVGLDALASAADAETVAERAFQGLPESFADAVSSHWYLKTAGQALLARQLTEFLHG